MNAIHQWLDLGTLPDQPIVGYFARSTSAFYAIAGGLAWLVSFNLRRFRPIIIYLGIATTVLGTALLFIDILVDLPLSWIISEGPWVIAMGAAILWLTRGIPVTNHFNADSSQ